jgi:hypothetical protein
MRSIISAALLSAGIAIGLLGAGYMVSQSRIADRFVEVKGLSEQVVKSDYASWSINYRATGDTLENALRSVESSQQSIIKFLTDKGFEASEIEKGQLKITDKLANPYENNQNQASQQRYIIDASITIRTDKVDSIVSASQQTLELAKSGVVLASDYYNSAPVFEFKGLDKLKPQMIEAATKDARRAADKFAKDSGAEVGEIRRATQGYFSIEPLSAGREGSGSSLYQKVRVVSTIEFFFE